MKLIQKDQELAEFCARNANAELLALDTEFVWRDTYWPKLCLIQLATEDEIAIVDPLAIDDLSPLAAMLSNPAILKVVHAAEQDMTVLYHALGVLMAPVFDTQIAQAFLSNDLQTSYAATVYVYCKKELPKAATLSNWEMRPLKQQQLIYAADDVRYLLQIYKKQVSALKKDGRLKWARAEMEEERSRYRFLAAPEDAYLHVRRASGIKGKRLCILRDLAAFRETTAQERNKPRKWIISDELLVQFSLHPPKNSRELFETQGAEKIEQQDVPKILEIVRESQSAPTGEAPKRIGPSGTAAPEVLALAEALCQHISNEAHIAPALLGSKKDLVTYLTHPEASAINSGWRYELLGIPLQKLISGSCTLGLKGTKIVVHTRDTGV